MNGTHDEDQNGSLKWLLSLDDEPFIQGAFEVILGRPADYTGVSHYKALLGKSKNRLQILSDLYSSGEAIKRHQRADISEAVFRYRHPIRSRIVRGLKADRYVSVDAVAKPVSSAPVQAGMRDDQFHALFNAIHGKGNVIQDHLLQIEYRLDNAELIEASEVLGDGSARYLFNLSTSNHWRSHAVGIVRVEREIASYLRRFRNVDYVLWDPQNRCLKKLARVHAYRILTPEWCAPSAGLLSYNPTNLAEAKIGPNDIYVSFGLDWDHAPTGQVLKYLNGFNSRAITACFDTVPAQFPEFLVRDEIAAEFRQHLVDMAHGSAKVWAISEATKRDLENFWEKARLERNPPEVFTVPLGSYAEGRLPTLNDHDNAVLRHVFRNGDYVLYVSSVEPRKNHRLMLDVWRELWAERGENCPQFVYVGMKGWGSDDMLQRASRMNAYIGGKINGLHDVSDNLLAHLYHHCSFTVFPSLYEGWGLAATEALGFGKVCIVANNSSLGEATQHLMPAYHPLDFPGWKAEIVRLLDDDEYRGSLEKKISDKYQSLTWDDVAARICRNMVLEQQK